MTSRGGWPPRRAGPGHYNPPVTTTDPEAAPAASPRCVLLMGDDGHIHRIERPGEDPQRLTWAESDFSTLPGVPALPGVTGDLEDSHVFAHPTPSPDGRKVAVFGLLPVDEDDVIDPRQLRAAHEPTEDDSIIGLPWGMPRAFVEEEEEEEGEEGPSDDATEEEDADAVGLPLIPVVSDGDSESDDDGVRRYWPGATIYVLDRTGISVSEVMALEDGHPHHLAWMPDGRRLLLLRQEDERLYLDLIDPDEPGVGRRLADGLPIFWAFEPGGARIAIRSGQEDGSHLRVLEPGSRRKAKVIRDAGLYHAPIWERGGTLIAVMPDGEGAVLARIGLDGRIVDRIRAVEGRTAFRNSPSGARLVSAVAPEGPGPLRHLQIHDGARTEEVLDLPIVAFDWLDDERLAVVMLVEEGAALQFGVLHPGGRLTPTGPSFVPTPESRVSLHFFEQILGSHPFLDGASRTAVVAGVRAGVDERPTILLIGLDDGSVRTLGHGRYGCYAATPPPRSPA